MKELKDVALRDKYGMNSIQACFSVGAVVHHVLFNYRGVVFDVDGCFSGTEEWYHQVAKSRPPKDKPWYHLLVDGASHTTYVAERHLEADSDNRPVRHMLIGAMFERFENGIYVPKIVTN